MFFSSFFVGLDLHDLIRKSRTHYVFIYSSQTFGFTFLLKVNVTVMSEMRVKLSGTRIKTADVAFDVIVEPCRSMTSPQDAPVMVRQR